MDQFPNHAGCTVNRVEDIDAPTEPDKALSDQPDETQYETIDQPVESDQTSDVPEAASRQVVQSIGAQAVQAEVGSTPEPEDSQDHRQASAEDLQQAGNRQAQDPQAPNGDYRRDDPSEKVDTDPVAVQQEVAMAPEEPGGTRIQDNEDDSGKYIAKQPDVSDSDAPRIESDASGTGKPPGDTPPSPPDEEDDWGEPVEPSIHIDAPFVPNESGQTGFGELLTDARNSGEETLVGIIGTESGERLEFEIDAAPVTLEYSTNTYMFVSVSDWTDEYFGMCATAYPNEQSAFFGVYTQRNGIYHQDMPRGSAAAFTEASLDHFRESGIDVQHINVEFTETTSVLFPKFEAALKATGGDHAAAASSATSGIYERLGFTNVDPDVRIRLDPATGHRTVAARFSKPFPRDET